MASSFRLTTKAAALSGAATIALTLGAQAAFADPFQFTVEDGVPLQTALNEFARAADTQILFSSDIVDGKMAPALSGNFEVDEGLTLLLADSGLDFSQTANGTLMVTQASTQIPASTTNTGPTGSGDPVSVEGTVRGAITDSNLKGARVEIVETGQTTATDDLGRFRFPAVSPGTYTLRISYLGRETIQETIDLTSGGDFSQSFSMGFPTSIGVATDVEVFGSRSARAQAINQERTAENFQTVVSSDLLGNFTGTTISESLRRAPGIAFQQDFDTGDGTNIIVRGLAPDLNTVKFNGIELPIGSGEGRTANLNNILSDSVDSVVISKTLLANQDSAGIGGLVEIETRSALDRPERFAQFSIEGRQRDEEFLDDYVLGGQVSGIFGAEKNFGIGASIQYRDREIRSVRGGVNGLFFGAYLPEDSLGGNAVRRVEDIAPGNPFPFFDSGENADNVYPTGLFSRDTITSSETLAVGLNAAWDVADHTSLRFDYQRLSSTTDTVFSSYNLNSGGATEVRPVLDQGGRELRALTDSFSFSPATSITLFVNEDVEDTTDIFTLRGDSFVNSWEFSYLAGYTVGENKRPGSFSTTYDARGSRRTDWDDTSFILPEAIDTIEGIVLGPFLPISPEDDQIPVPLFTEAGFASLNDTSIYRNLSSSRTVTEGENSRFAIDLSAKYSFENEYLDYIEFGLDYERSEFESVSFSAPITQLTDNRSLQELGIPLDAQLLGGLDQDFGVLTISPESARQLAGSINDLASQGLLEIEELVREPSDFGVRATEEEFAPFIQARFEIGDFEIIPGVRYSDVEVTGDDLNRPRLIVSFVTDEEFAEANTFFQSQSARQSSWLPRVVANYRPNEKIVARAGYFKSVARPQLGFLSQRRDFTLSIPPFVFIPTTLNIFEGNPDLEPAETNNFDLSVEYYFDDLGVVRLSGFYKEISNLTELNTIGGSDSLEGVDLPPFETADLFPDGFDILAEAEAGTLIVNRVQPFNNDSSADIWGIEVSGEKQFSSLPGMWRGLGVYGNLTYTQSEKSQPIDFRDPATGDDVNFIVDGVRFNGDPEWSGSAAVTYNAFNIDAALVYSYQDRRQTQFVQNGFSNFEESFETLDFSFNYLIDGYGGRYQLVFEATDLLRDFDDATLVSGRGTDDDLYYTDRSFLGGREFRVGLTATF